MMLLTKEIKKRLPSLYSTEKDPDPIIRDEYARIDTLPVEPETRPWGTSNDLAKSPQGLREKHMRTKKGAPTMAEKEAAQK